MNELNKKIIKWANDKDLLKYPDGRKQIMKMLSEAGEICDALVNENRDDLIDAIGDTYITVVILCEQMDTDMFEYINMNNALNAKNIYACRYSVAMKILDYLVRFSRETLGSKECRVRRLDLALQYLSILAKLHNTTLEHCVQTAYDVIKDRTGRTVNGTFIKD